MQGAGVDVDDPPLIEAFPTAQAAYERAFRDVVVSADPDSRQAVFDEAWTNVRGVNGWDGTSWGNTASVVDVTAALSWWCWVVVVWWWGG
jgi:hypothetical protein